MILMSIIITMIIIIIIIILIIIMAGLRPIAAEFLAAPTPPVWPVRVVVVAELYF